MEQPQDRPRRATLSPTPRPAEDARIDLTTYLARGIPVLLCIEQWDHWVTAVHEDDGLFVLFDSRHPAVVRVIPWELLRTLWVYHGRDPNARGFGIFDLHPVVPRRGATWHASFTAGRTRALGEWENRSLTKRWGEYLNTLSDVAVPRSEPSDLFQLSPGAFFARHEEALLTHAAVSRALDRPAAREALHHLRFVADTYDMMFRADDERHAVTAIAALLDTLSARAREATPGSGQTPLSDPFPPERL